MSWIVYCGGREVWSPALKVGFLFLGEIGAIERMLDQASGSQDRGDDTMEVDALVLGVFLRAALDVLGVTRHATEFALVEGPVPVALAVNARITGQSPEVPERLAPLIAEAKTVLGPMPD